MKRSVCRRCCVLLIPGLTAMFRHRNKRQKHAVVTCLECGTFKRYVGIPEKIQLIEKDESWQETVTNGVLIQRPQCNQQGRKKNKGNQANNKGQKQNQKNPLGKPSDVQMKSEKANKT